MIFVRLRNDQGELYGSYTDYWKLVELSGFATCEIDEIEPDSANTYVLAPTNGNAHAVAQQSRRCGMIAWALERPTGGYSGFAPACYDSVWVSDRWLCKELLAYGAPHVRYVTMGGHPGLGGQRRDPRVDFTHQAYMYGRRLGLLNRVLAQGYQCNAAGWGAERDECLATARMGLCLHQDELPIIEPLRFTLFACWRLPLVCEASQDVYPYQVYGLGEIDEAKVDARGYVAENHRMLTETLTFRHCVEEAM